MASANHQHAWRLVGREQEPDGAGGANFQWIYLLYCEECMTLRRVTPIHQQG